MSDEGLGQGDANDLALDAVSELIQQLQPGSMVQRFVLVVETIDDEDRWLSAFTAPGQKRWDTMGLLQYGLAAETNFVVSSDEDDDE